MQVNAPTLREFTAFSNFECEISNLIGRAIGISKQLNGWIESLKDSKIKGPKYFTKKERDKIAQEKEFAEFDAQMAEFGVSISKCWKGVPMVPDGDVRIQ